MNSSRFFANRPRRSALGSATHASRAPASRRRLRLLGSVSTLALFAITLVACGDSELRDWRPDDHGRVPGPPPGVESEPLQQVSAGDALWGAHCARCHGVDGAGGGPMAPGPMPDLTNPSWVAQATPQSVAAIVRQGRGMMPAFADTLSPQAIEILTQRMLQPGGSTGASSSPEGPVRDPGATTVDPANGPEGGATEAPSENATGDAPPAPSSKTPS